MAWRDRVRRRTAPSAGAQGSTARRSDAPGAGAGERDSTVPADWDGGWRRTAAPRLTVSRAPLAVSDGLVFRSGLAAWRDPSFDTGLAHGVLPSAPTGLVRGVARPATGAAPAAFRGGGPLLLRALPRGDGEAASPAESGSSAASALPGARRTKTVPAAAAAPAKPQARPEPELPRVQRRARADGRKVPDTPGPSAVSDRSMPDRPSADAPQETQGRGSSLNTPSTYVSRARQTSGTRRGGEPSGTQGHGSAQRGLSSENSPAVPPASEPGARPMSQTRGIDPSGSPVQRSLPLGDSPAVLHDAEPSVQRTGVTNAGSSAAPVAPGFPPARRIAVVPPDSRPDTPVAGPRPPRQHRPTTAAMDMTVGARADSVARSADEPRRGDVTGRAVPTPTVRPRSSGRSLVVARSITVPVRRIPALRPARPAEAPAAASRTEPTHRTGTSPAPGPRAAGRPPLGAPLAELPPTATPLESKDTHPSSTTAPPPALPVVQSKADDTAPPPATRPATPWETQAPRTRTRTGIGAPLASFPASAELPDAGARASRAAPAPRTPVQRAPQDAPADVPRSTSAAAPGRGPAHVPLLGEASPANAAQPLASPGAPHAPAVPGTPEALVQRSARTHEAPSPVVRTGSAAPGPESPAVEPAATGPLVQRSTVRPDATGTAPMHRGAAAPDVQTPETERTATARRAAPARPADQPSHNAAPPLVVARAVTGGGELTGAAPTIRPSVRLLSARPLTVSTGTDRGMAPPSPRTSARPVVAARWPRASAAPAGTGAPHPGAAPAIQRAPAPPGPPAPHVVRTTPAAPPPVPAPAPVRALPVTAPPGQLPTVQPTFRPPQHPVAAASTAQVARVVQRDTTKPERHTDGTGGEPKKATPAPHKSASASTSTSVSTGTQTPTTPPAPAAGLDLDDLARRLIDPVSRLLRTELRRGRERTGRPTDRRR